MTPIKAVMMKWIARRAKKNEKCETTHNIDEPKTKKKRFRQCSVGDK